MLTNRPRISWKYEDIDDVISVDNTRLKNDIEVYSIRDSVHRFSIGKLFFGRRSLLKPFIRSYIKVIQKGATPKLFLVTNQMVDQDAAQLFFRMERLRMNDITLPRFKREGGNQTARFMRVLNQMRKKISASYGVEIDEGDFLRAIYRPIVVDKDMAEQRIKSEMNRAGKIEQVEIENKYRILLYSVAHTDVCTLEWVDSQLNSKFVENYSPIIRQIAQVPTTPLDHLRTTMLKDSIIDTDELTNTHKMIEQIELHFNCGNLFCSAPAMFSFEKAKENIRVAWKNADSADEKYLTVKKHLNIILKNDED